MNSRNYLALLSFTALLSMSIGYELAQGQQGLQQQKLAETDLGQHFQCMQDMTFKISRFEIAPDFTSPEHNHKGRPGLFYVLDGSVVEHQGSSATEYSAGEGFAENSDLTQDHRIENISGAVATVIYAQIIPPQE